MQCPDFADRGTIMQQPKCLRSRWGIAVLSMLMVGCMHSTGGPASRARGAESWSWRLQSSRQAPAKATAAAEPKKAAEPEPELTLEDRGWLGAPRWPGRGRGGTARAREAGDQHGDVQSLHTCGHGGHRSR